MSEWVPAVFSIVGALFGLVATTLMGMCVNKLSGIDAHLEVLNGKFFTHVTDSHVHGEGLVRLEEQVKQVLSIAKIANDRADRLETRIERQEDT